MSIQLELNDCLVSLDFPTYSISHDEKRNDVGTLASDDLLTSTLEGDEYTLSLKSTQLGSVSVEDTTKVTQLLDFVTLWNEKVSTLLPEVAQVDTQSSDAQLIIGSLKKRLALHRDDLISAKDLRIRFASWNVHGDEIYDTDPLQPFEKLLTELDGSLVDIIVICLQETIPLNAKNLSSSLERVSRWENIFLSKLPEGEYTTIQTNRLLGLTTILLSKTSLSKHISNITTSTIGTGLLGIWANKGSIMMNFTIGADEMCSLPGMNLQIFNAHLASGHGREMLDHRRKELFDIQRKFPIIGDGKLLDEDWAGETASEFARYDDDLDQLALDLDIESYDNDDDDDDKFENDNDTSNGNSKETSGSSKTNTDDSSDEDPDSHLNNGITFFLGDLNYRIFMERTQIESVISENDFTSLLDQDGLTQELRANKIFVNFKEHSIEFPPTYKFGDNGYDYSRIPSYCDRILYTPHRSIEQLHYSSLPDFTASDHKPISSTFSLSIPMVNMDMKTDIVTKYFKEQDKLENSARPVVEITKQDLPVTYSHCLIPATTSTVLKNNGKTDLSWEIIVLDARQESSSEAKVSITPMQGSLVPGSEQEIKITCTIPILTKQHTNTAILRVHNAQDFFVSYSFLATESIFGVDLAQFSDSSGIPGPLYSLVIFLSGHGDKNMFDDILNFIQSEDQSYALSELDYKLIRDLDDKGTLDVEYLEGLEGNEAVRSVLKILILLLRNSPNGIVSSDFSIKILRHFNSPVKTFVESPGSPKKKKKVSLLSTLGNEEVSLYLLELLPNQQANLLIFFCNFLKILISKYQFDKMFIIEIFQDDILRIPMKVSRRKMVTDSTIRNLKKRRTELVMRLLDD